MAHTDFIGRELAIDDSVLIIVPNYREYALARVIAFTPKQVRVIYGHPTYGNREILQWPSQLVKMDGPDLTLHLLKKSY
jgi:hypothetical protein